MSPELGTWSLTLAVLVAAAAAVAAVASARLSKPELLGWSRRLVFGVFVLMTAAMWALARAMVNSDFSVAYVASYTERALPWGYKLAALWAGQEGSVLLWAWLLALMAVIFVFARRRQRGTVEATTLATLALIQGFFAALLVFAADPFAAASPVPPDGYGLNPLLQHPSMIAHPPLLFVGYAGCTFPFAMLMGVLVAGRRGDQWIMATRRWLLGSWAFLAVGILLGAQWAYVELGWGGYWAWDPVENASLLPWLTATALLHSIGAQRRFGMFRQYNAWLVASSFLLCILATYLTRSGVIQSVHAFGQSLVGTFFLGLLIVGTLATIVAIVARRRMLKPDRPLDSLASRPGMFLIGNTILVLITVVIAVGTMFPLISGPFVTEPISVGPPFYNKVVLPMAMVLMAAMAAGPLLRVGEGSARQLVRGLRWPAGLGALATAIAVALGLSNLWALACVLIVATALVAIVVNLGGLVRQHRAAESVSAPQALVRIIDRDHRRFGGQAVHLGMFMLLVGVAGSSLFNAEQTLQLAPGESAQLGRYTVTYRGLSELPRANYTAIQANVTVAGPDGRSFPLTPQQRFYNKSEQAHAEVALRSTLVRDVYLTLAGWENNGQLAAFQGIVNPLVSWIWIGGLVMTLGAVFCMFPPLLPAPAEASEPRKQPQARPRTIHLASPTCSETLATNAELTP